MRAGWGRERGEGGEGGTITLHCHHQNVVQELCESRGGRPGLSVLAPKRTFWFPWTESYTEPCFGIGLSLSLICHPTSEDIKQHYLPTYHQNDFYIKTCSDERAILVCRELLEPISQDNFHKPELRMESRGGEWNETDVVRSPA